MRVNLNHETSNLDVSVVICTKNAAETIEAVLQPILAQRPLEIIIVDGHSIDTTVEMARPYATRVVIDPGKGLAVARNLGLRAAKGEYVCFIGADNVLSEDTLGRLKSYLLEKNYVGVAALTRIYTEGRNYFVRGADLRWQLRFREGAREVIGTPYMFKREVLLALGFDDSMSWSDDSDLAVRLKANGLQVGYSDVVCMEIGYESFRSLVRRFQMYGLSDYEYYSKYSPGWTLKRKIYSGLHPFLAEFVTPLKTSSAPFRVATYIPFFAMISLIRYYGFVMSALMHGGKERII